MASMEAPAVAGSGAIGPAWSFEVNAPMGPLGLAFDDRQTVAMMLPSSWLRGQVKLGDTLLHING